RWTYSGVRPLYDDGATAAQEATRDYIFKEDGAARAGEAVLVNIFGGKITTYRELAERMMEKIEDTIGRKGRPWTAKAAMPGGDFPVQGFDALVTRMAATYPFVPGQTLRRLCNAYGTRIAMVMGNATKLEQLGEDFGNGLYEVEVRYLMTQEWARTAEDIIWRRSKLGLVMSDDQIAKLETWLATEA
ncbi:MAG: glycerol-3-phosphate dehydrogenase C-terminal domain-containing protein, partial [Pseudomonadota bacterium]